MPREVSRDLEARIDQLARLDRFSSFSDAEIRAVRDAGTYLTVPPNWALMVESTPADKAYLILSGTVSIRRDQQEITTLGPGEIIGEIALVQHRLRSATVVAQERLEALHFTAEAIQKLRHSVPNFADALARAAAERTQK